MRPGWREGVSSMRDTRATKRRRKARNGPQLVMHVTSKDHRMNVTDSENGKYHQCGEGKENGLTDPGFIGGKSMKGGRSTNLNYLLPRKFRLQRPALISAL